jgi:hypothetical protein
VSSPAGGSSLNPGAFTTYNWTFSVAGAGTVNLSFTVIGTDDNTGAVVISSKVLTMSFISGANLAGAVAQVPAGQTTGLDVVINYTVSNTGGVAANSVTPALNINTNGGLVSFKSGPTPASANIPAGGMQTFSWTYSVNGGGTASITYTASGSDAGSGYAVQDARTVPLGLMAGAKFETSIHSSKANPSVGQNFNVLLTVSNTGGVDCNDASGYISVNRGAGLVSFVSKTPATTCGIVAGTNQLMTFTYQVTGAGPIEFTATGMGTDSKAGYLVLSASTISLTSVQGAVMEQALEATPSNPLVGEWISIVLTARNTGNVTAAGVRPGLWFTAGSDLVVKQSGPTPAGPVNILAGTQQLFTWTYSISGKGTVAFTATAQGYDQNSLAIVSVVDGKSFSVTKTRLPGPDTKGLTIAPNVLDYSRGNATVNFILRGDPGGTADLRIYNEAGHTVLYKTIPLENGQKVYEFDGRGDAGQFLGSGVYWVVASGGGVKTTKKPLIIVTKRKK